MSGPRYHESLLDGSLDRAGGPTRAHGATPTAPKPQQSDAGERISTIERKEGEQLRLERRSYNGYPFLDLRVWFQGDDGEWRPTKKGLSIKPRELDEVIAALTKARGR